MIKIYKIKLILYKDTIQIPDVLTVGSVLVTAPDEATENIL